MFKSEKTAFVGSLFFAGNYAMVIFGLTYFMDIGGWFFYTLSIYYLYQYIESGTKRALYTSALAIAVGALMKESVPFAYIVMFIVLFYENRKSLAGFIKKIYIPTAIAFVPMLVHHLIMYIAYDYSYWQFILLNHRIYNYKSRFVEYVKNFGSLLNFLAPVALAGLIVMFKSGFNKLKEEFGMDDKKLVFIGAVPISALPAVVWPGITQRVLFMVVFGLVMVACFFIKRYEKYWYVFVGLALVYAVVSLLMDSVILNAVNLPL